MVLSDIANQAGNQATSQGALVVCTGGGTAGHVVPGLAVARILRERGCRTVWIGGTTGMERRLVRAAGISFYGIPVGKLRRYLSLKNLSDVFRVLAGVLRARSVLGRLRPKALFSKGGFASVPAVIAAWSRRIPVVTHESDSDPGLATLINARFSRRIAVPYPKMERYFPVRRRRRVVVTGNPVRSLAKADPARARTLFELADESRPLIVVLGGSQGARRINHAIASALADLLALGDVVHQAGAGNLPSAGEQTEAEDAGVASSSGDGQTVVAPFSGGVYRPVEFIRDGMEDLLSAADLIICRAGAATLWENAMLQKPMILVPLVVGSRGDQVRNAARFARSGAALVLDETESLGPSLVDAVRKVLADRPAMEAMGQCARNLVVPDADRHIADLLLRAGGVPTGVGATARSGGAS